MPLTPADVHNVAFSKPPIGKRGYNEDEVDAFLDMVEQELTRLIEENIELKQRVEELDQQVTVGGSAPAKDQENAAQENAAQENAAQENAAQENDPGAEKDAGATSTAVASPRAAAGPPEPAASAAQAPGGDPGDHNVRAAKILGLAQEMADRLTGEAKTESDQVLTEARSKSEQMLSDAKSKSETMVTEARSKSEAMLSDAKSRSETMQRQAKEKADALQAESERKHTEMLGTIIEKRTGLEKHIDELSTFEREYRSRLKSYLESQLHDLVERGDVAPEGAPRDEDASAGQSATSAGARADQGN